jgi:hypothetical protein
MGFLRDGLFAASPSFLSNEKYMGANIRRWWMGDLGSTLNEINYKYIKWVTKSGDP